jgi:putative transcriptional regulator
MRSMSVQPSSLTGHFLIAMPNRLDEPFNRGVAFICQHGEEGAVGLLVNRISEYRLGDVLAQMKLECGNPEIGDEPVLIGGPVQQERGFVLHSEPGHWDASYRVNEQWSVTTSRDILVAMANGEGPRQALLALGYAGWSAGQLEQELKDNAWLTAEASSQVIFDTPLEDRWSAAAGLVGVLDPAQLANYAGHA